MILVLISTVASLKCISLKNQECKVREVIVDNKYMTYPYNIKVNRCNGNCNNVANPFSRSCVPDITKNVTLKIFDLMTLTNKSKQIIIHGSCKCICRLGPIVCSNKQKWNKNKSRCECLINKKCGNKFWNPSSCKWEFKEKAARLTEECEEVIDNETVSINKTITTKEKIKSCKPFVVSSILFLLVSVTLTGVFIYCYISSWPKYELPYLKSPVV